jgi:CheY-like chemotaxis protein
VARARVLVVEGDEPLARGVVAALEAEDFAVELRTTARAGFQRACELLFDCIVCATELPDIDGAWLARRLRTEAATAAKTPILFVGPSDDPETRAQALAVGGDVFVGRPVSNDDVVAQVTALVAMSRRLRGDSEAPPSSTSMLAAIRGDLSLFPLASILMMFELERRSGSVDVVASSGKRASLLLVEGLFATTEVGGRAMPAIEALREVLSWRTGRFSFMPRDPAGLPPPRASVGALVLEAMRLEDEVGSGRHVAAPVAPAAGGPAAGAPAAAAAPSAPGKPVPPRPR